MTSPSIYDQKIIWLKNNPTACAKPFNSLFLLQGVESMRVMPCCNWREEEKEFGKPFSQLFQDVKQDILEGRTNSQCHICAHNEQHNNVSERMRDTVDALDENFKFTPARESSRMTIKFSNLCNLACRVCQPEFSSLLAEVMEQPANPNFVTDITEDPTEWPIVQQYLIDMLDTYQFLEINVTGGEAMIQPGFDKFMVFLNELRENSGRDFSKVVLSATTNGTSINQYIIDAIPNFLRVSLTFSIDSVGDNYHYVRWPARFERVQRVVDQAVALQHANPGRFDFNINLVIGANNIFYVDDIARYWDQWNRDTGLDPSLSIMYLHWPPHMAVEVLPKRYRDQLVVRCQAALEIAEAAQRPGWNSFRTFLQGVINFCNSDSEADNKWQEYLTTAADYDRRTKCTMQQFNTRLWDILTESDQQIYTLNRY